jgi:hypothetical protein
MKAHVELSPEQINVFKRTFHDVLSKRFIGHWFPGKYIFIDKRIIFEDFVLFI